MKALEYSQYYILIFQMLKGSLNSIVSGGIWPKFELIKALMYVLVTCKN